MHCEGKTGFPDLLLVSNGYTLFIEVKSPTKNGRLSTNQVRLLRELDIEEQDTRVVDSKEDAAAIIEKFDDLRPRLRSIPTF